MKKAFSLYHIKNNIRGIKIFLLVFLFLTIFIFIKNKKQTYINRATEHKKTPQLVLVLKNTVVAIGDKLEGKIILKDNNNLPLPNKKIVITYNSEWNYAEYKKTDERGEVDFFLEIENKTNRSGFCGSGGSRNLPSSYQLIAYFQGDEIYLPVIARGEFGVVNKERAVSSTSTQIVGDVPVYKYPKPTGLIYWGWDYQNLDPADAPEDLFKPGCQPGTTYKIGNNVAQCRNDPNKKTYYGPFGSLYRPSWESLAGENGPDLEKIEKYLNQAKQILIDLPDGKKIPKPVILGIHFYSDQDFTPNYIKNKVGGSYHLKPEGCEEMTIPKMCEPQWQEEYKNFIYALGNRFDKKLSAVLVSLGYDDEAVWVKNINNCDYKKALAPLCPETEFKKLIKKSIGWYRDAFPNTPVYLQGLHEDYQYALSLNPAVGMKTDNWTPSTGRWVYKSNSDINGESKLWLNHPHLPRGFESSYGAWFMDGEENYRRGVFAGTYWMLIGMLTHRPEFIDLHSDHFNAFLKIPYLSQFVNLQLGKNVFDTPVVWTVLRDLENGEKKEELDCWISGFYGDYMNYLYRRENLEANHTTTVSREELPTEAKYQHYTIPPVSPRYEEKKIPLTIAARKTNYSSGNNYMSFDIDNAWAYRQESVYTIGLVYLDLGSDKLILEYPNKQNEIVKKEITKTNTKKWILKHIVLNDAYFGDQLEGMTDFRIYNNKDGDEIVHRVEVWRGEISYKDEGEVNFFYNPVNTTNNTTNTQEGEGEINVINNIKLKINFKINVKNVTNQVVLPVKVIVYDNDQLIYKTDVSAEIKEDGYWKTSTDLKDIIFKKKYRIFLKPDRFLSKEVEVIFNQQEENLDFKDNIFLTGDINNDNVINSYDLGFIINNLESKNPEVIKMVDLNYDQVINTNDFTLALLGLIESNK